MRGASHSFADVLLAQRLRLQLWSHRCVLRCTRLPFRRLSNFTGKRLNCCNFLCACEGEETSCEDACVCRLHGQPLVTRPFCKVWAIAQTRHTRVNKSVTEVPSLTEACRVGHEQRLTHAFSTILRDVEHEWVIILQEYCGDLFGRETTKTKH